MQVLLLFFYLLLFLCFISGIAFYKQSGLPVTVLPALFILKLIAAYLNTLYYSRCAPAGLIGGDSGSFYYAGVAETAILLRDPLYFLEDLFRHHYVSAGNLFLEHSYWNDLKSMFIIKLLAVCNIFTFKSYFGDLLFFNFFFFFGSVAFFRFANELFPGKKYLLVFSVFCIPGFLFWCSSIHKDGFVFTAIGLIFYSFHHWIQRGFTIKRALAILFGMLLLFALRNYVCFLLFPVLLSWWLATRLTTLRPLYIFASVYILCLLVFFTSYIFSPTFNFPQYIITRQHAFSLIVSNTKVTVPLLSPCFGSFVNYLPTAIDMAIIRPHWREINSVLYYPLLLELYSMFTLVLLCIFFKSKTKSMPVAGYAGLIFAFSILLIIGYTITFSGAIMRYRSLVFPLILTMSIGYTDISGIGSDKSRK